MCTNFFLDSVTFLKACYGCAHGPQANKANDGTDRLSIFMVTFLFLFIYKGRFFFINE
jgi:uncharacterized protein (DUF983 family)